MNTGHIRRTALSGDFGEVRALRPPQDGGLRTALSGDFGEVRAVRPPQDGDLRAA